MILCEAIHTYTHRHPDILFVNEHSFLCLQMNKKGGERCERDRKSKACDMCDREPGDSSGVKKKAIKMGSNHVCRVLAIAVHRAS